MGREEAAVGKWSRVTLKVDCNSQNRVETRRQEQFSVRTFVADSCSQRSKHGAPTSRVRLDCMTYCLF